MNWGPTAVAYSLQTAVAAAEIDWESQRQRLLGLVVEPDIWHPDY